MKLSKVILMILLVAIILNGCGMLSNRNSNVDTKITEKSSIEDSSSSDVIPTSTLISYDPERKIYFSCNNWDVDIYMNSSISPVQEFQIISKSPVNIEDINISIPIESDYAFKTKEITTIHTTDYLNSIEESGYRIGGYPYYLYQCYKGMDWKKLKEMYVDAQEAEYKLLGELKNLSRNDPEYLKQQEIVEAFYDYRDLYLEDYKLLTPNDLPIFYVYNVQIWFGASVMPPWEDEINISKNRVTESFQTIEINIGEQVYTQNIGDVRLYNEYLPKWKDYSEEIGSFAMGCINMNSFPWGDGKNLDLFWHFKTKEEIIITGMYLYEENAGINLIGAHVILKGKTTLDFYWDLKMPFEVEAGTDVQIELLLEDMQLKELEYAARIIPIIEYEVDNRENKVYMECGLDRFLNGNTWLRYVVIFEGLDVESYFDDYYRPIYETWREEVPW